MESKLIRKAREFAQFHHESINQRRKYTGEPYISHPSAVAKLVSGVPHTEAMIAAAWLHDTVEDTPATMEMIVDEFGVEVAALVEMLTDVSRPEDGNRAVRKLLDLKHTAKATPEAKTIKLADLIHNSTSIIQHDRAWAKLYLEEKSRLLEVLKEGDASLFKRAREIVDLNLKSVA